MASHYHPPALKDALPNTVDHVILDRDGVLNVELDGGAYLDDPSSFRWLPGTLEALAALRTLDVRVSVATNQSGIGRRAMTEAALAAVHEKMRLDSDRALGPIAAVFYCPHAPEAGCSCRKPAPGLILAAVEQSGIVPSKTLVVGDSASDLQAARAASVRAVLLRTGKGRDHERFAAAHGFPVFDDLRALVAELFTNRA
jgi:D-glycero-D-manno-heptose 1,7-bisphosphate phosphatase